jgi:hypothetical protein
LFWGPLSPSLTSAGLSSIAQVVFSSTIITLNSIKILLIIAAFERIFCGGSTKAKWTPPGNIYCCEAEESEQGILPKIQDNLPNS